MLNKKKCIFNLLLVLPILGKFSSIWNGRGWGLDCEEKRIMKSNAKESNEWVKLLALFLKGKDGNNQGLGCPFKEKNESRSC